jgi:hypothetical protein
MLDINSADFDEGFERGIYDATQLLPPSSRKAIREDGESDNYVDGYYIGYLMKRSIALSHAGCFNQPR